MTAEVESLAPDVTDANTDDKEFESYFATRGGEDENVTPPSEPEPKEEPKVTQNDDVKEDKSTAPTDLIKKTEQLENNYKAMAHEERKLRKEAMEKVQRMETTLQRIVEMQNKAQEPQVPSYEENPLEALRHETERLKQKAQYYEQRDIQQQQLANFQNAYSQQASEFRQANPDFMNAYEHYKQSKYEEYFEEGDTLPEATERFIKHEIELANRAFQKNANPAERIYKLAQKFGYKNKTQQQASQKQDAVPDVSKKLEQQAKGIAESKSLSDARTHTQETDNTLEKLSKIDDPNEFLKQWKKMITPKRGF